MHREDKCACVLTVCHLYLRQSCTKENLSLHHVCGHSLSNSEL